MHKSLSKTRAEYDQRNLQAAAIILADIPAFGGEGSLAVQWARAVVDRLKPATSPLYPRRPAQDGAQAPQDASANPWMGKQAGRPGNAATGRKRQSEPNVGFSDGAERRRSNMTQEERQRKREEDRRYREANRDRRREADKRRYQENRERLLEAKRAYREANRERLLKGRKRHYEANRDRLLAAYKKHYEANRDRLLAGYKKHYEANPSAYINRARAREQSLTGSHTQADIDNLYRQQHGRCANPNCRREMANSRSRQVKDRFELDHIVPVCRGGTDNPGNLQLLCPRCNAAKRDKDDIAWAQENGMLFPGAELPKARRQPGRAVRRPAERPKHEGLPLGAPHLTVGPSRRPPRAGTVIAHRGQLYLSKGMNI
jgi:hypothetical protein